MELAEGFVVEDNPKLGTWGHGVSKLKHEYESDIKSEVKVYKLSKEELDEYIKNIKHKSIRRRTK